jgi:putative ABC transport system permease protein
MFDVDRWQEILTALKKNKLRTFFTAFGVFCGIFMLVVMQGSGTGLSNAVYEDFRNMATNSVFIWPQRTTIPYKGFQRGRYYNFRNDDTEALRKTIPEIELIAPRLVAGNGRGINNVVRGIKTGAFNINGDYPEINAIDPVNLIKGRFLNEIDIKEKRKVAVIGVRVQRELFESVEDPIAQYIRIKGVYFEVIGIFQSKRSDQQADFENQSIFIPLTTLQMTYNYGDVLGWYSITSRKDIPVSIVEEKAKALLATRHNVDPQDIRAVGSFNLEKEFNKFEGLFAGIRILIWIVGIGTLFAGVVGVSNIMLIIVKERTREIGIMRSIGATPWNIMSQIVAEAIFLTTIAGYLGLVAGVGIIEAVNYLLVKSNANNQMFKNPEVDFSVAMIALAVLVISGAIAGMIPAMRAIRIRPIDALRDE